MLADPCADPGISAKVVQALLPENSSDNGFCLFCPQLLQFYSSLSMVYFKENNFTRFVGGGRSNLFQGVKLFPGGGGGALAGGPNANSRNP